MIEPDFEKYRQFTKDFDMTDVQKDELIMAVWTILNKIVDQSFGLEPLPLSQKNDGATHLN